MFITRSGKNFHKQNSISFDHHHIIISFMSALKCWCSNLEALTSLNKQQWTLFLMLIWSSSDFGLFQGAGFVFAFIKLQWIAAGVCYHWKWNPCRRLWCALQLTLSAINFREYWCDAFICKMMTGWSYFKSELCRLHLSFIIAMVEKAVLDCTW